MSTIYLRRVGNALFPEGDEAIAELVKLPFGRSLRAEIKQPRNPAFHRLYWSLCARIASGVGRDAEEISTVFKFATGHVTQIHSKTYGYIKVPQSISFGKLDEAGFRTFFDRCLQVAWDEWKLDPAEFSDLLDPRTEKRA